MEKLLTMAGGESQLVAILISLREDHATPFVAIRAEQLLPEFSSHPEVLNVLSRDLLDPSTPGFAAVIISSLTRMSDEHTRRTLAELSFRRASAEARLVPPARMMLLSSDPVLRALGARLPLVVP